ncbi:MAG: dephospho-CoA kinase [Candidatus Aminicenantes bacterium]|nr:dephospho-CoA kinase [Candidatus Aminicenantes bacterium]MBL7083562.1 dephospho-CoA kinase [Candidatus Aminicenantes bacterium]
MLIVALTGGIAVGKSVVANILKELGCYIHHSDKIAHDLSMPGEPAWEKIVAHFGEKILKKDKTINRAQLGKIIFSNKKEQAFLNELIHPLVFEKKKEIIKTLKKEGRYKIFVSEAALTIEAGFADFFDKIITTHCRKEVQIDRLMKRDQISRAEALNKIKSQMPPEEKLKYADYIIDSSGSLQSTIEQTERVYRNLMLDYEMKYAVKNEKS